MPYSEGQTATGPGGQKIVYSGGKWRPVGGGLSVGSPSPKLPVEIRQGNASASSSEASAGRTTALTPLEVRNMDLKNQQMQRELGQSPLSPADQQFLNAMRTQQGDMGDTIRTLGNAAHALDRLNPGPMRATALSAAIPEEGGGLLDKAGGALFGGVVDPQTKDDFQTIQALQNAAVLDKQIAQKGPQTEADAIRMQMASLSPYKYIKPNAEVLGAGMLSAQLAQHKPDFYTRWANKYGSVSALSPNGQTADAAWANVIKDAQRRYDSDPRIKQMRAGAPKQQTDDGWKVERIGD